MLRTKRIRLGILFIHVIGVVALTALNPVQEGIDLREPKEITLADKRFRDIFKPLDGSWQGEFLIFQDPHGQESGVAQPRIDPQFNPEKANFKPIGKIKVSQTYRSENPYYQTVIIKDIYGIEDGKEKVISSWGVNKVQGGRLWCIVKKPDELVVHEGERRGDNTITWFRHINKPMKIERFRETVKQNEYTITGWGYYGQDNPKLTPRLWFKGNYIKIPSTAPDVSPNGERIRISNDLELIKLSKNVYIHTSFHDLSNSPHFPANGLIYMNNGQAFIIDTTWDIASTRSLLNWIKNHLKATIVGIIITHWHVDCMGGLKAAHEAGIKSYSSRLTRETAKLKQLPIPEVGFNDSLTLKIGNKRIDCFYLGPGHTSDNIVVWLPEEKILFAGCLVKALNWKILGFLRDSEIDRWPHTLNAVLSKFSEAKIVIPGHGQYGGLMLIKHTLELLRNKR